MAKSEWINLATRAIFRLAFGPNTEPILTDIQWRRANSHTQERKVRGLLDVGNRLEKGGASFIERARSR